MYLKAKYENIKDLGSDIVTKSSDIEDVLTDIDSLLKELENSWSGKDYDKFIESYKESINKASVTAIELNAIGHAIKKVGIIYSLVDNDFFDEIESMRKNKYE